MALRLFVSSKLVLFERLRSRSWQKFQFCVSHTYTSVHIITGAQFFYFLVVREECEISQGNELVSASIPERLLDLFDPK